MTDAAVGHDLDELVNATAIAERLVPPLTRQRVWQLSREDPTFPSPAPSARGTLWRWGDVVEWTRTRARGRVIHLSAVESARLERIARARGQLDKGRLSREAANALVAELLHEAEKRDVSVRKRPRQRPG